MDKKTGPIGLGFISLIEKDGFVGELREGFEIYKADVQNNLGLFNEAKQKSWNSENTWKTKLEDKG